MKQYRKKNREQIRERAKQYCERTKEVRKQYTKQYIQNNLVKAQTYYRNYNYNYYKRRRRVDKLFKAKCALRAAVSSAFKRIGQNKPTRTEQLLGCSWIEAKAHFDRLFQEGMSWENHGKWHIDHIRPVGSFKADELHLMNHISNLQPLWAYDNMITKKIADNLKWGNGTQPTE